MRDRELSYRVILGAIICALLLLISACSQFFPSKSVVDIQAEINTAVAATVASHQSKTELAATATSPPTAQITIVPSATPTPLPTTTHTKPASTYTKQPSPTAVSTSTIQPEIWADVNTNCRLGPSRRYKIDGYLLVGTTSNVYGRDSTDYWWYIQNPTKDDRFCWVWSETTHVEGNPNLLPVTTPSPMPKAYTKCNWWFSVSRARVQECSGEPVAFFRVHNNSCEALESGRVQVDDLTTGKRLFGPQTSNAPFLDSDSCLASNRDRLAPGQSLSIAAPLNKHAKPGHYAKAVITLCTREGLGGHCYKSTIKFKLK
ncbi:MAG: hypothetical protein WBF05_09385 [Anaerolineales bacterium]